MAIAPKLQLKQGQSLVMTPQLQQAIKLLQLSNIELATYVDEQLESNPLLERGTGDENRRGEDESFEGDQSRNDVSFEAPAVIAADLDAPDHAIAPEATAADVGGAVDWSKAGSGGTFNSGGEYDAAANTAAEVSLSDHLTEQLLMSNLEGTERLIARHLIDNVDENGYLRVSLEELAENLGVSLMRVQSLVTQLQSFEPTGVFARDLRECLLIQLRLSLIHISEPTRPY